MKKLISLILALCMACMLMPALAEEDITGEWYASYMGAAVTLTLNADGTATLEIPALEMSTAATWTLEGDVFTLYNEDGEPAAGKFADGVIAMEDEELDFVFTREPVEVFTPADVNAEAAEEDFTDDWACVRASMGGMVIESPEGGELLTIADGSFTFYGEESSLNQIFGTEPVAAAYEAGAYTYAIDMDDDMPTGFTAQLLVDDTLALTITMAGYESVYYFERAAE